ncbi:MAG: hypothetical protein ABFS10_03765 [Bacteroidota bacterium]
MKKITLLLIASVMITGLVDAQVQLFLEEQSVDLPDGSLKGWVFPVINEMEEARDDFDTYCKNRSDVKMKKENGNLLIAEKISIPSIATKRGDLIITSYMSEQNATMALVFRMGYDISLNSKMWPLEMENLHNYARAFMAYHYEQSYARRLEPMDKELEGLVKEKEKVEKDIQNIIDKIGNQEKKIGKETDAVKIETLEAEKSTLEADKRMLEDAMPPLVSKIDSHKSQVDRLRSESTAYQSAIGAL